MLVEAAADWALLGLASNNRETVAVLRTLLVVVCTSAQGSPAVLRLAWEAGEVEPRKI
jgi:hypothetical protein